MEELSNRNKGILVADEKGYKVQKDGSVIGKRGSKLKFFILNRSYNTFSVKYLGTAVNILVHRFQAYQKYGDSIFEDGIVVRHLDGNSFNNSWDNIAIGTQRDNIMDKPAEQRRKDASSPKHDHNSIIEDHKNGMSYREVMNKYNISSKGTVSFIIRKSMAQETSHSLAQEQ